MRTVELKWGMFLQTTIDFIIIAFAIFLFIQIINKAMKKKKEPTPSGPTEIEILSEIRDLLKKNV